MEGLRKRAMIAGAALLVVGAFIQMSGAVSLVRRTEAFLEDKAPMRVGEFVCYPDTIGKKPKQSYVLDESTYTVLKPFGIVGRVFLKGDEGYDVLLIASNNKESFHDQRVCFSATGWTLTAETEERIQTSRGIVPLTFARMRHAGKGEQITAYCYKGPDDEFVARPQDLTWAMFKEQFRGGQDLESVFYRFIPTRAGTTKEELLAFIKSYLEEARTFSGGYF